MSKLGNNSDDHLSNCKKKLLNTENETLNKNPKKKSNEFISDKSESNNRSNSYVINVNQNEPNRKESNNLVKLNSPKSNYVFIEKWFSDKNLYLNLQIIFLVLNLVSSFVCLGLSIWINIDSRFLIIKNVSTRLTYSSLSIAIGYFGLASLIISNLSIILDLLEIFNYFYIRNLLNSFEKNEIEDILNNQKILAKMGNLGSKSAQLEFRSKIKRRFKSIIFKLQLYSYGLQVIYIICVIGSQYAMGIYLHFESKNILTIQISQTLSKLFKFYLDMLEKIENNKNVIFTVEKSDIAQYSLEQYFTNQIHKSFKCCAYKDPFEYGVLAPEGCNFEKGCLASVQKFLWYYVYFAVIFLLLVASLKVCIHIIIGFNFRIILIGRLLQNLFEFNPKKSNYTNINEEEDEEDENERYINEMKRIRLRREKELLLQREEEEEEKRLLELQENLRRQMENEKIQNDYEKMLKDQNRLEELKIEQNKRKVQLQHDSKINKDVVYF